MRHHSDEKPRSAGSWVREHRLPSVEELAWLRSAAGVACCREMAAGRGADTPAAIAHWRERLEPHLVTVAWGQVVLRRAAAGRFSRAADMLFDRVGLEQATDEVVAAHKAKRFAGLGPVADLCCGIGGDALALAAVAKVTVVDWSAPRVAMAEHNARVYSGEVTGLVGDAAAAKPEATAVHVDPDRRPEGRRRHDPELGSPNLTEVANLVRHYANVAVKLSPGADFEALPFDAEVELISHHGECKQAVAWTGRLAGCYRRATALPAGETVGVDSPDELTWPPPGEIAAGRLLYEPDAAVVRAHLVGPLARQYELAPVDPLIAYLVGDREVRSSLLAGFQILEVIPWSTVSARELLRRHDVGRLEIKTRGFAGRPEDLFRKLRPKGQTSATLLLTRLGDRPVGILAQRLGA